MKLYDDLKSIIWIHEVLDYDLVSYRTVQAVKMDILVHGDEVSACHKL